MSRSKCRAHNREIMNRTLCVVVSTIVSKCLVGRAFFTSICTVCVVNRGERAARGRVSQAKELTIPGNCESNPCTKKADTDAIRQRHTENTIVRIHPHTETHRQRHRRPLPHDTSNPSSPTPDHTTKAHQGAGGARQPRKRPSSKQERCRSGGQGRGVYYGCS